MEKYTFADGLILAIDLKSNNAMPGRDRLKQLTGLNEGQCRKIINLIKEGFADYFFSKKRRELYTEMFYDSLLRNAVRMEYASRRLADIHHADLENFKHFKK